MRSIGFMIVLAIASVPALAETTFHFDTGNDWRGERIELPPKFAPTMEWKGVEVIRFAPGMFRADSDYFFTYVVVFLLDEGSDVSPEAMHREIITYFRGLATSVMKGKRRSVDADEFKLKLSTPPQAADDAEGRVQIAGSLDWVEPFTTLAPQSLNLEIGSWKHGTKPVLCITISPQLTDHVIWTELRRLRKTFRFED